MVGDDGLARCRWGALTPEYRAYHDEEWGRPVGDDGRVYEHLCLEGFQTGLSWIVILRKREGFRRAFASFEPRVVASFGEVEIDQLVNDAGIVRHRAKIAAAIANAKATVALQEHGVSLAALVWQHEPSAARVPAGPSDVPSSTPESTALSKALRGYGFAYVGPTTVYSAMQSLGVVNDHLLGCHWHDVVDAQRRDFHLSRPVGHAGGRSAPG